MTGSAPADRAPVAIIGIACRFPGGITGPESYWRLLAEGKNAIGDIPADRFDADYYYDARPAQPGRIMSRKGGYLGRLEEFDAAFFGISPREAERVNPEQRILCELAWEAFEDAGQNAHKLAGTRTGVFIGQWQSDFEARLFGDPESFDFYKSLGGGRYVTSGRISYLFDLRGPCFTLDNACAASLTAAHLAAKSIQSGESDLAVAGGVNLILMPYITIAYSQAKMMAPDGQCKFGDAAADGYVRSEGAGLVVLKRLDRALADGDRVYAVIRGGAIAQDGRTRSIGTVSRTGQEGLLRAAYRDAGVDPARVRYVEAHGTGTRGGDHVELAALGSVLAEGRAPGQRALVGSVKTNLGHMEAAAGVAGLIKAALALHHDAIPASLHFVNPSPRVAWGEIPLDIPRERATWPQGEGPRLAGVNAFGIAGSNAHVVLEEAPPPAVAARSQERATSLLPISAKSREALVALAGAYAELLERPSAPALQDACWSATTRRAPLDLRAAFVAPDRASMAASLRRFASGEPASAEGQALTPREKVVFVLPGQGGQWVGMGRELVEREPAFRTALEQCDQAARRWADFSLLEQLRLDPGAPGYRLGDIDVIQPMLVALAIAYAELWKSFGVQPSAVIGHSMGEVGAAYLAGVLDLDRAMQIICRRSALMRRTSGKGAMALVELSFEEAEARIAPVADRVAVGANNSPRASILSGEPEAIQAILAQLEREKIFCRLVKVDVASHSPQMAPAAADLSAELAGMVPVEARIPIYSTVLGRRAVGNEFDASYWGRNLRQSVLFGRAVAEALQDGATAFVELGPHPVLVPSVQQQAQSSRHEVTAVVSGRRSEPEQTMMLTALGALWANGTPVALEARTPEGGRNVPLPLYPWQRERHWVAGAEVVRPGARDRTPETRPDEESLGWLHAFTWAEAPLGQSKASEAPGSWLVAGVDAAAGTGLAEGLSAAGARAQAVTFEALEGALARQRTNDDGSLRGLVVLAPDREDAPFLAVRALQGLLAGMPRSKPRLWLVSRGAQVVSPDARARVAVDAAAVWGAGRVIAEEHPNRWGGLVDLDPAGPSSEESVALGRALVSPDGEEQSAWRGGERFALRLSPYARDASALPFRGRADAAYLITGGLGGAGLHVAKALAARGVRRLVLMGRTPLPSRGEWSRVDPATPAGKRVAAVRELEALGVAVQLAAVDASRETELRAFLDGYAAEAWPPIRGIFHAAAVLDNRLAADTDRKSFDAVMAPKVRAAKLLDTLLPDLDVFVFFSSVVGWLGEAGQANYAAANTALDALAQDRRARGLPATSIAWGIWKNTGLVNEDMVKEFERQGMLGFTPERATPLLGWLCASSDPAVAVMPMDWPAFRRARMGRGASVYGHLAGAASAESGMQGSALAGRLARAEGAERRRDPRARREGQHRGRPPDRGVARGLAAGARRARAHVAHGDGAAQPARGEPRPLALRDARLQLPDRHGPGGVPRGRRRPGARSRRAHRRSRAHRGRRRGAQDRGALGRGRRANPARGPLARSAMSSSGARLGEMSALKLALMAKRVRAEAQAVLGAESDRHRGHGLPRARRGGRSGSLVGAPRGREGRRA